MSLRSPAAAICATPTASFATSGGRRSSIRAISSSRPTTPDDFPARKTTEHNRQIFTRQADGRYLAKDGAELRRDGNGNPVVEPPPTPHLQDQFDLGEWDFAAANIVPAELPPRGRQGSVSQLWASSFWTVDRGQRRRKNRRDRMGRELVTAKAANPCCDFYGFSALGTNFRSLGGFSAGSAKSTRTISGVNIKQRRNQPKPDLPLLLATIAPTIAITIQIVSHSIASPSR